MQMVGDLIVIFHIKKEPFGGLVFHDRVCQFVLPIVALVLIHKTPFDDGQQLLGRAAIIRIVGFAASRDQNAADVVNIVAPHPFSRHLPCSTG